MCDTKIVNSVDQMWSDYQKSLALSEALCHENFFKVANNAGYFHKEKLKYDLALVQLQNRKGII